MKRIIAVLSLLLSLIQSVSAQVSVSCSSTAVSVKVKRCIAVGDDVFVDLVFTGTGKLSQMYISHNSEAYDDEGNKYLTRNIDIPFSIHFESDSKQGLSGFWLDIPKDVPRKVRMRLLETDEYASCLSLVKLPCDGNDGSHFMITIKNLPIDRQ